MGGPRRVTCDMRAAAETHPHRQSPGGSFATSATLGASTFSPRRRPSAQLAGRPTMVPPLRKRMDHAQEPLPIQLPLEIVARILSFLRPCACPTQFPENDLDYSPGTAPDDIEAVHQARRDLCEASLVCRALLPVVQRELYGSVTIRSAKGARLLARTLISDARQHNIRSCPDTLSDQQSHHFLPGQTQGEPLDCSASSSSLQQGGKCECACHQPPPMDRVALPHLGRPLHTLVQHLCITHNDGLLAPHDTREDNAVWPESLRTLLDHCTQLRTVAVIVRPLGGEVLQQLWYHSTLARVKRLAIHSLRYVLKCRALLNQVSPDFSLQGSTGS